MTLARRLVGLVLLVAAARWAVLAILAVLRGPEPVRYGVAPWGDPYGVRLSPLSPAETMAARDRERDALEAFAASV